MKGLLFLLLLCSCTVNKYYKCSCERPFLTTDLPKGIYLGDTIYVMDGNKKLSYLPLPVIK